MLISVELYKEGNQKRVWIACDDGSSGAGYPYETAADIGEKVALYLETYYPDAVKIGGDPIEPPYYHVTNIRWDTTSDEEDECGEPNLPTEVDIPYKVICDRAFEYGDGSKDPAEREEILDNELSDYLSDIYGFCHYGYESELITE